MRTIMVCTSRRVNRLRRKCKPILRTSRHRAFCSPRKYCKIAVQSTSVTSVVLDASALMAFLHSEPGGDIVWQALSDALISAVNYSEVLKKAIERGKEVESVAAVIRRLSLVIVPFDEQLAMTSATRVPSASGSWALASTRMAAAARKAASAPEDTASIRAGSGRSRY